jgi:transcriptional regulator with XRE-family HTH domain
LRPVTTTEAPSRHSPIREKIKWARENPRTNSGVKISQERFATLIGTSRRHLMRIERGQHVPRGELVKRIAEATGHELEFFSDDDEEESSSMAERSFAGDLAVMFRRAMRPEIRREVAREFAALKTAEPTALLMPERAAGSDNPGG